MTHPTILPFYLTPTILAYDSPHNTGFYLTPPPPQYWHMTHPTILAFISPPPQYWHISHPTLLTFISPPPPPPNNTGICLTPHYCLFISLPQYWHILTPQYWLLSHPPQYWHMSHPTILPFYLTPHNTGI